MFKIVILIATLFLAGCAALPIPTSCTFENKDGQEFTVNLLDAVANKGTAAKKK
ncbi:MAG: hypothetical protein QM504_08105 [Pseudomonadota bacterium]